VYSAQYAPSEERFQHAVQRALEAAGVEFLPDNGVKMKASTSTSTSRNLSGSARKPRSTGKSAAPPASQTSPEGQGSSNEQGSADQSIARAGRGIAAPMEHRNHPRAYPDLRIKYLALSITPTGSIQKRSTPLFAAGALIALGAAVLFVLGL
jgi:hypothetical protein